MRELRFAVEKVVMFRAIPQRSSLIYLMAQESEGFRRPLKTSFDDRPVKQMSKIRILTVSTPVSLTHVLLLFVPSKLKNIFFFLFLQLYV